MLDNKSLEWLETREIIKARNGFYFCGHCQYYNPSHYDQYTGYCACDYIECPLAINYKDAAEFEARVAAKLAETAGDIALLLKQAGLEQLRDWQLLRIARLAAEEQMGAENADQ